MTWAEVAREHGLAKYADVAAAERDGYRMFAPKVKHQKIYHYSNRMNALKARWTFDATAPSALQYQPGPSGELRLIGAMYTAPPGMSLEDLNQRIPLSIAQWHQHTSLASTRYRLPRHRRRHGSQEPRPALQGRGGSITTEEECEAAGGELQEKRMGGWMVHLTSNLSGAKVWEHPHLGEKGKGKRVRTEYRRTVKRGWGGPGGPPPLQEGARTLLYSVLGTVATYPPARLNAAFTLATKRAGSSGFLM